MGNVIEYTLNEDRQGFIKPTLVKPQKKFKVICSREDWKRMNLEEKMQKECKARKAEYFYSNGKLKPKKDRPKISKLTKRIFNWVVLQDA
jgi:hypothetical protein|tara:strand:+ start:373 stop:642 length:270 start_codon:yes stop_codon:yes gene_type:complete